jgi:two-component system phosphate regulon response regulator PhoB
MTTESILIVDDEETLCEVLKINLENEGYDVDTALSAEEALRMDLRKYSLILLDIMMGEISGIRLARMLKADVSTSDIPIIFCTARDSEDDMVKGLNLGADDYITKP